MEAVQQSVKIVHVIKVHVIQRKAIEFFYVKNIVLINIHEHVLNIYGDQTVDESTVRQ